MKKIKFILPLSLIALLGTTGCKKYLDVNKDPNNPQDVQEALLLVPTEFAASTDLAGGALTIGNFTSIGQTTAYWMQQTALNQLPPQTDEYRVRPDDMDQQFLILYSTLLQNLQILNNKAAGAGHHSYGVIAKVLTAYTLGITTDMFGDIPYSQALNGALHPAYDKQEDVYKKIQSILDSAILENGLDPSQIAPSTDDLLYGGHMAQWQQFAYSLKARYYLHLTKAPGYNAATQAGLALAALQNGFSSKDEQASFAAYADAAGQESPWNQNIIPGNGPIVVASTFVNFLKSTNDPRISKMITKGSGGDYLGRIIGTAPAPDPAVYSQVGDFYSAAQAPQALMTYAECQFIKAEATFIQSGAAAANPLYIAAINSHMDELGIDPTSTAAVNYVTSRTPLTSGNALQRIIEDKWVANFLSIENFNDWRRTGFPVLTIVQQPYVPTIPRRMPYALGEITSNPQPQQALKITDRVWWDAP